MKRIRSSLAAVCIWCGLLAAAPVGAQAPASPQPPTPEPPTVSAAAPAKEEPEVAAEPAAPPRSQQRTAINLLGQTDTTRGESRRNENVQFNLIDNNALKELNIRLGATATLIEEFRAGRKYFGAEYGNPPAAPMHAAPRFDDSVHGSVFESHNNSVFSARSFFQAGDVQPAGENFYGGRVGAPLGRGAFLSLSGSQNKIRGNVNGNVLIPLPEERVPLTNDPELRTVVERFLSAFPDVRPNRPDIADRALNTNSPQRINTDTAAAQLSLRFQDRDQFTWRYAFTGQSVDAFQFVRGQNPDTDTKNHSARVTWNRAWSASTVSDLTAGFDRLGSLLQPAVGAVGPAQFGDAITGLGPSPIIPIDRAQNRFRGAGGIRHNSGRHQITAGFSLARLQYNGEETDGHRGILGFRNDFGRTALENLRWGTPSSLIQALGTTYRGFRNWETQFYAGDKWQPAANWTLNFGLRWELFTRPDDATGRSELAFDSDRNNWAPSFGLAYRLGDRWGVLRANYGLHYGQIFPVTYSQDRLNAPHSLRIVIQQPNLLDPLAGVRFEDLDPNGRSSKVEVSPDLATPYSQQYNFSWELAPASQWRLQMGYVGSRSPKLIQTWFLNRAVPVDDPGRFTTGNINERRPDQRVFEHLFIQNASIGYYDAARVSLIVPRWRGLTLNTSYWFSKAIDLGSNYTNTASGPDARVAISQVQWETFSDLKALSDFDQPHAFLLQGSYETPRIPGARRLWHRLLGSWVVSSVFLWKTGTPFTVESGSDGPGFGNVDGSRGDRPMLLDRSVLGRTIGTPDTSEERLPRSAFRFIDAPRELAGNLGRNTFRKGGIANVNASLSRRWPVRGDVSLTFRADSINFFNTPQFAEPTKSLTSPSFAQINNTLNDGRTFRFLLRLEF